MSESKKCDIPAGTLPPCDMEWGHEGDMHGNAGDGFYAREFVGEHHRRQRERAAEKEQKMGHGPFGGDDFGEGPTPKIDDSMELMTTCVRQLTKECAEAEARAERLETKLAILQAAYDKLSWQGVGATREILERAERAENALEAACNREVELCNQLISAHHKQSRKALMALRGLMNDHGHTQICWRDRKSYGVDGCSTYCSLAREALGLDEQSKDNT